jgi:hypothetical protein
MDLTQHWSRLSRCTQRLIDASDGERHDLRSMSISFVALAITTIAASSTRRGVPPTTENELIIYIQTAKLNNLVVNDNYNGRSAVELAAYHGLTNVLTALLHMGCPLKKSSLQGNAIFASVRNGQHASLNIILKTFTDKDLRDVILEEESVIKSTGIYLSTFKETMTKGDTTSAKLLKEHNCLRMSDIDSKKCEKVPMKLRSLLQSIHPEVSNFMHWQRKLNWSFPPTDYGTINWLWHVLHRDDNAELFPDEVWLRVFSYFPRGWFACRKYETVCRYGGDVVSRNIIGLTDLQP